MQSKGWLQIAKHNKSEEKKKKSKSKQNHQSDSIARG